MSLVTIQFTWLSNYKRKFDNTLDWFPNELNIDVEEGASVRQILSQIFRACNRVDGSDCEIVPDNCPSMSVGDLVVIDDVTYFCGGGGWYEVDNTDALKAFMAQSTILASRTIPQFDKLRGYLLEGYDPRIVYMK